MRLAGKVAVVTGSGSGIGRAVACLLAKEGAEVVVAELDPACGQETVRLIREAKNEATFVQVDVSKVSDLDRMIVVAVETYGKLNILCNNAGIPGFAGIEEIQVEQWDKMMDILAKAGFFGVRFAIPEMRKAGGGSIIFTSSVAGLVASAFSPVYSAAKGAVVAMTRAMAVRLAPENIRVNCICPGPIDTPLLQRSLEQPFFQREGAQPKSQAYDDLVSGIPLGRVGRPEDVAYSALFLASDESSFITGIALPVDGGFTAR
jgi:NAD(P)-dependent dehydrogenase (short-subunit alcohol dehydrogenase family)